MQLWVPDNETSETFMTADKFLRIYEKVSCMIDVDPAAEVRFEYGEFLPVELSRRLSYRRDRCVAC